MAFIRGTWEHKTGYFWVQAQHLKSFQTNVEKHLCVFLCFRWDALSPHPCAPPTARLGPQQKDQTCLATGQLPLARTPQRHAAAPLTMARWSWSCRAVCQHRNTMPAHTLGRRPIPRRRLNGPGSRVWHTSPKMPNGMDVPKSRPHGWHMPALLCCTSGRLR